ncbi:zinc ribbon domain-containing protein [candidate division KSB1 bacterium]|nr:zinc ribbon domain-containing protein [candidate division KSB1 bacterium]
MPIYEFKCDECEHHFDELVMGSSALANVSCPKCTSRQVVRMMSAFGFSSGSRSVSSTGGHSCGSCSSKNCATCS